MKRLLVIGAAALIMAAGCGPTDTLTVGQVRQMDPYTQMQLANCQGDEFRAETTKEEQREYSADLLKHAVPYESAMAQMWNDGYGPDFCEQFHPDFEGEE